MEQEAASYSGDVPVRSSAFRRMALPLTIAAVAAWFVAYRSLPALASTLTRFLGLNLDSRLGAAAAFFAMEVSKVLMLLVLVVFAVGVARSFFTPETTGRILLGKRESAGNFLAALLGVVTPFCSCSAVPLIMFRKDSWRG